MRRLSRWAPQLVLAPSLAANLIFVQAFVLWTAALSFTGSRLLPRFDRWVGLKQYVRLWSNDRWHVACGNLLVYAALFIIAALALGLLLAILINQEVRGEGALRAVYLYPMALSSIVTGVAWQWILNPELGIERLVRSWGLRAFTFDWLVNSDKAIYTVVLADVWRSSGYVMLLFLAGLRSMDQNLLRAASIDGAGAFQTYRRVVLPALRPVFLSAIVLLAQRAIMSYDMVLALTGGGPGYASDLPAVFMVSAAFQRSDLGLGAAAAVMMLLASLAVVAPYLAHEQRRGDDA